jgi:hypothetical protein
MQKMVIMCAVLCLAAILCNLSIKGHQEVIKHPWICNSSKGLLSKNDAVQYEQGAQGISKGCIESLLDNLVNFTMERINFVAFSLTNYNWGCSERKGGIAALGKEFLFEDMHARLHYKLFIVTLVNGIKK